MRAGPRTIPPKISTISSLKFFAGAVLGFAILCALAVLFFFNPATHGFYPVCLFHVLTGFYCPGCGGTRAVYQLLHGHLLRALHDNALFVLTLTGLTAQGARFVVQKIRNRPAAFTVSPIMLRAFLVTVFVFTVLRNLPAFAWLSP
jgi:hypothetical protein